MRERGYNQSSLLAQELSNIIRVPVVEDCLIRNQYALSQTKTMAVEQRRNNVARAFACRNRELAGKEVLLIDDVATSGATLNACAATLKAAGAASVWGLVVAQEI
jgi:predicted amidophosphoribosyltransferase